MSKLINYSVLIAGSLAALMAFALIFVAAPRYEPIFVAVLACDAAASAALFYMARRRVFLPGIIALSAVVIYTLLDVALRHFAHSRISELF